MNGILICRQNSEISERAVLYGYSISSQISAGITRKIVTVNLTSFDIEIKISRFSLPP